MHPVWAQDLYRQHHCYIDKYIRNENLTPEETMQRERVYSLIEAYEAWDCNGVESLILLRLAYDEFVEMENDINAMLASLQLGEVLERSESLRAMARHVVEKNALRTDEDIVAWAKRLADDASQWND